MKPLLFIIAALFSVNVTANTINNEPPSNYATATFAGGCFWCMEPPYDKLKGVISTTSGYMGGHVDKPTYQQVSHGSSGHTEVVQVIYDPAVISYKKLLQTFWHNIDPTDARGQFCDKGTQYRTEIFYHNAEQRELAQQSKTELLNNKGFKGDIVTPISAAPSFFAAENYHQDYYQKNPIRYKYYRYSCGRDNRLEELWGEQPAH